MGSGRVPQSNVKTTRIELIRTRAKIAVARKGLDLLKMKRSSLVLAFFELARQIRLMRGSMRKTVQAAMESAQLAELHAGRITLDRIAMEQSRISAGIEARNVMGVRIPNVGVSRSASLSEAYELISVPTAVEDAKRSYSRLFNMLIEIAEKENSLRLLLYEIEKINRRANAIENFAIPNMRSKATYIKGRLDDMERDQLVSIKFIKGKISG
jgi:V/A-type H+-transporting ATPase subunit D